MPHSDDRPASSGPENGGRESHSAEVILRRHLGKRHTVDEGTREELLTRYPSLAKELRELFDLVETDGTVLARILGLTPDQGTEEEPPRTLGDFIVLEELGRGGMGTVHRAQQVSLNREVALKILPPHLAFSDEAVLKFRREAEAGGRQQHPGIVAVYAVGEQDGLHFIAQELVTGGRTLADELTEVMRKGEPPPGYFRRMAELVSDVTDALEHAHRSGVIHRDVKPSNILLTEEGIPKVTDFGLAKIEDALALSRSGDLAGTPYYMSPEQAGRRRIDVDFRTDIYSLGVTFYELLTFTRPFEGRSSQEVLKKIISDEPRDPLQFTLRVPRDLSVLCLKAMEKDPRARYQSMKEFGDDVRRYLTGEAILARPTSAAQRFWKRLKRNPGLSLATCIAAAAVLSFLFSIPWYLWKLTEEREVAEEQKTIADREKENALAARNRAVEERILKEEQLALSESLRLAVHSSSVLSNDPGLALLLAMEGLRCRPGPEAKSALAAALDVLRERRTLVHDENVVTCSFCPEGRRIVTGAGDDIARVFDSATGREIVPLRGPAASGMARFSPDGRWLAGASDKRTVRVRDAVTGTEVSVIGGHQGEGNGFRFSPDGKRLVTVSEDGTVRIWNVADGREIATLRGQTSSIDSTCFSPDGLSVITAPVDGTARLRKWSGGEPAVTFAGHDRPISRARFSPDGRLVVTASLDDTARIWDTATGDTLNVLKGHADDVIDAVFDPEGERVLTASSDHTARIWDVASGGTTAVLAGHEAILQAARFSPDGRRVVTCSSDATARLWRSRDGEQIEVFRGHKGPVFDAAFDPTGRNIVTASADGTARIWRTRPEEGGGSFSWTDSDLRRGVSSPDGRWKLIFRPGTGLRVVTVPEGKAIATMAGRMLIAMEGGFSPDGARVVAGCVDGAARIWDARSGSLLVTFQGHGVFVTAACFSPDGERVLSGSVEGTGRVWNASTGEELCCLEGHEKRIRAVAFSPDGSRVVTGSEDGTARIWDSMTGAEIVLLAGHELAVTGAVFGPDGSRVVTSSADDSARVWHAATGAEELRLVVPEEGIRSAVFSPDGSGIAVLTGTGTIKSWPVDLLGEAERRKPRSLTYEEKKTFAVWTDLELSVLDLVESLFAELIVSTDVVSRLQEDRTLSNAARAAAIGLARLRKEKSHHQLVFLAWLRAREADGSRQEYEEALRLAEAAYRLCPAGGTCKSVLGVARCRAGRFEEALAILEPLDPKSPRDIAIIALCHHHLDHSAEAASARSRLHSLMVQLTSRPHWPVEMGSRKECDAFLGEVEATLEGK